MFYFSFSWFTNTSVYFFVLAQATSPAVKIPVFKHTFSLGRRCSKMSLNRAELNAAFDKAYEFVANPVSVLNGKLFNIHALRFPCVLSQWSALSYQAFQNRGIPLTPRPTNFSCIKIFKRCKAGKVCARVCFDCTNTI